MTARELRENLRLCRVEGSGAAALRRGGKRVDLALPLLLMLLATLLVEGWLAQRF